jgi:uncharacterized protein (DUF927 family)
MVMSNTQSNPRRNEAAKDGAKASRGGRAKAAKNATSKPASARNGHDKSAGAHRFPIEAFTDEEILAAFGGGHRDHRGLLLPGPGGPLLNLVQGESGGLHYEGHSCSGKSSQHCAAASVWGKGEKNNGFVQSWHNTANAFEGVATMASDTGLVLDELSEANAADVGGVVYMLGNESGKGRMRADTSMRAPRNWRVAVLSSGEKTLAQKIAENHGLKAPAGVEMRMVNVNADAGKGFGAFDDIDGYNNGAELADALKKESVTHYGVAGPAFVRAIIEHGVSEVRERAQKMIVAFRNKHAPKDASPQVLRVAKRLGVIAVAGELAIKYGVLPWPKGQVESAASWALKRWINDTGAAGGIIEDRQAIAQIRQLIEEFGDSRFDPVVTLDVSHGRVPEKSANVDDYEWPKDGPFHDQENIPGKAHTRYGFRRGSGAEKEWLVFPEVWREVFCKGFDAKHVASLLAEQGKLKRKGAGTIRSGFVVSKQYHPGYILTSRILDEPEEEAG